ncbi:MAM and LDL-receptor class A domain-containing protein 1-like [Pecten maximus]|uniref:MAM and LDL-receptor class A domain-containing protein 1-like n=1 Tax=Pecten maximus TaxID=6579 RepID=UPI001457FDBB|nr:MAM and LDL-receptor class A domain-containing protein 1-like [Pecten maximus]
MYCSCNFVVNLTSFVIIFLGVGLHGLSCDFDNGLCDWLQINRDQFDWREKIGRSPEGTSGPLSDHTGNGSYVYVSGGDSQGPQTVAILSSPSFYLTSPTVFSFWYHMNGVGIGNLSLLVTDMYGDRVILWSKHGRQGPDWQQATLHFDISVAKVEFVASAKYHYNAIIAVDDIKVNIEPVEVAGVTSVTDGYTSRGPIPSGQFPDCHFDQSMCMWQQSTTDELDWHRVQGSSPDRISGPTVDHTSGNGHYLLLVGHEARTAAWSAHLFSPLISVYGATKMTFWFHMNGIGIGHLRLIKRTMNAMESVIWTANGRQGTDWQKAEVILHPGRYQLIFEASAKLHYGSDLAIDDITIDPHPEL